MPAPSRGFASSAGTSRYSPKRTASSPASRNTRTRAIDHMTRPDPRAARTIRICALLELLGKGNFLVMLSLGEKTSQAGAALGRCDSDRADQYRGRARPLRLGQRLAASGLRQAATQRCRSARIDVPLRPGLGDAGEDPRAQSGKAVRSCWLDVTRSRVAIPRSGRREGGLFRSFCVWPLLHARSSMRAIIRDVA